MTTDQVPQGQRTNQTVDRITGDGHKKLVGTLLPLRRWNLLFVILTRTHTYAEPYA